MGEGFCLLSCHDGKASREPTIKIIPLAILLFPPLQFSSSHPSVFFSHWVTPEPIGDDLRCTGGLTPKNPLIAKQTE